MARSIRQSPSGPKTIKRFRQIYNLPGAPLVAPAQALLEPTIPTAFLTGVSLGDTVCVTANLPFTYGFLFTGSVTAGEPNGVVVVIATSIFSSPITSWDLTVEVFRG